MFEEIIKKIHDSKIIPVVKMDNSDVAVDLAHSLYEGGIKIIEITFRTLDGEEGYKKIARCIKTVSENCPEMLIGAGTVINKNLAKMAVENGAKFIVSPGFNPSTVDWCLENKIPVFPGVDSPSQIEWALEKGLTVLKFFPAEVCGGTKMLKALSGPFPNVSFLPSGGINSANAFEYIQCPNVLALSGSWMVKEDLINQKKWDEITTHSREAVLAVQGK